MKKKTILLYVFMILAICTNSFQPVYGQNGNPTTYLVEISGVTAANQGLLANYGVQSQGSSGKVLATLSYAQLENLRQQGFAVEILKSSDPRGPQSPAVVSLSNPYLILNILDSGQFTMRTADGRYLLYPFAETGYLSVKVDGSVYSQRDATLPVFRALAYVDNLNANIQFKTPENILLTLRYILNGQAVQFLIESQNLDGTAHAVNARFLLDTQVDTNDGSPLYAPNIGVQTKETDFPQPPFRNWRGYDTYPNPLMASEGTFATQPYRVVFAHWPHAINQKWDYTPDPSISFYTPGYTTSPLSDSCVLLYFSLGNLSAGAGSSVSTYYGVGAPTAMDKREQVIGAFLRFKESVRNSILADIDAYAALQAKYYVSMRPGWKDYVSAVWTLADPLDSVSKYAKLGKDAKLIKFYVDQISYVAVGATMFNALGDLATGIPASAGEIEIRDTYMKKSILNDLPFFSNYHYYSGMAEYLNQIDQEYLDFVNHIPNPLPANYPADFIITQLMEQSAGLDASANRETFVPVYYNNQCSGMKLGALQQLKANMIDELSPKLEFANDVSWGATVTSIALVLGGAGLKVAGVIGVPVTVGGSSVVLIPSETALWSGVAGLDLIAGAAGSIGTIQGMTIQGAMSVVSLQAVAQYANDFQYRKAIFQHTGDWLVAPSPTVPAEAVKEKSAPAAGVVEVVSFTVPNLTVAANQASGQGTGQVTVKNNTATAVNIAAYGDLTTEMNGAMPTVGFVGSTGAALAPGETKTLSFPYSVLRSTLVSSTGYDMHLFVTAANSTGSQVLGPYVAHFYTGTAAQLASLGQQTFADLKKGESPAGQVISQPITLAANTQNATLMLSFSQGSDFDLHLYNGLGQHTGINYDSGLVDTQIPGVTYSGASSSPEYMTIAGPVSGTLEARIVVHNTVAGDQYHLTLLNSPALPAILDAPGRVDWSINRTPNSQAASTTFALQIAEGGGSQPINNLKVTGGALSGGGRTLPASQFICSAPATLPAGSSVMASCTLLEVPKVLPGTYTGLIQITGKDALNNPLTSTANVTLIVSVNYYYFYIPKSVR